MGSRDKRTQRQLVIAVVSDRLWCGRRDCLHAAMRRHVLLAAAERRQQCGGGFHGHRRAAWIGTFILRQSIVSPGLRIRDGGNRVGSETEPPAMSEAYSVVIPAFNSEKTIQACLRSVAAQTLAPLQVLVIDDASGDGTEAAVRRCEREFAAAGIELQYFRLARNAGPSAARNKGIREAAGNYIAFLDADDTWSSNKLAIVDRFVGATSAGLVCHDHAGHRAEDMRQR